MNSIQALIYNFCNIKAPTYSSVVTGKYEYPAAGIALAFFLVLSSITMIPIYTVTRYALINNTSLLRMVDWSNLGDIS